jgi:hypothetical protein
MIPFSCLVAPSVSLVRRRPVKRGVVGDDRPGESGEKAEPFFREVGERSMGADAKTQPRSAIQEDNRGEWE